MQPLLLFQNIVITPKQKTLYPLAAIPHFLLPPVPDNHASTFYHYAFAHLGHCIYMTSYNQWFWVTAFFLLAWCFIHVVAYQYFIPWLIFHCMDILTIFCLCTHQLMDIRIVSWCFWLFSFLKFLWCWFFYLVACTFGVIPNKPLLNSKSWSLYINIILKLGFQRLSLLPCRRDNHKVSFAVLN